jgi:DNA-binding GntR family transcriptional regulator
VLETLREEQAQTPSGDSHRQFDVDHKFHEAVARAAHNKYLAESLERLFGLSQRLWYLVLTRPLLLSGQSLGFLPSAVEKHVNLVEAIQARDAGRAEAIMREHVAAFYTQVREILEEGG